MEFPGVTNMSVSEHFEVVDGIAFYRPVATVTFREAIALAERAIAACHECGASKILIDSTRLDGFKIPTTFERFQLGEQLSGVAKGIVIVFVSRPEMIDPAHFGVTVAKNRG